MSDKNKDQLTRELLARDFALVDTESLTEEELFRNLADHIDWLISHRLEWLLSLMYRMDIDEDRVNRALHPSAEEPANIGLARLVLARQKQRAKTKLEYQAPKMDEDLAW